jgi:hypothetical protein
MPSLPFDHDFCLPPDDLRQIYFKRHNDYSKNMELALQATVSSTQLLIYLLIHSHSGRFPMRSLTTSFTRSALMAASLVTLATIPAMAQDAFDSSGATGNYGNSSMHFTGSQTMQGGSAAAPMLQGATFGTIGPQGTDATVIQGINTSATVRVNNLANLEALLNIIANGMEILGIAWGGPTMIMGFMHMAAGTQDAMKRVLWGMGGVTGGLATPGCINWLVASARDANLFS